MDKPYRRGYVFLADINRRDLLRVVAKCAGYMDGQTAANVDVAVSVLVRAFNECPETQQFVFKHVQQVAEQFQPPAIAPQPKPLRYPPA